MAGLPLRARIDGVEVQRVRTTRFGRDNLVGQGGGLRDPLPRRGLADALRRLAGDAALRDSMGARARALLCERYDKQIALNAWLQLLREL